MSWAEVVSSCQQIRLACVCDFVRVAFPTYDDVVAWTVSLLTSLCMVWTSSLLFCRASLSCSSSNGLSTRARRTIYVLCVWCEPWYSVSWYIVHNIGQMHWLCVILKSPNKTTLTHAHTNRTSNQAQHFTRRRRQTFIEYLGDRVVITRLSVVTLQSFVRWNTQIADGHTHTRTQNTEVAFDRFYRRCCWTLRRPHNFTRKKKQTNKYTSSVLLWSCTLVLKFPQTTHIPDTLTNTRICSQINERTNIVHISETACPQKRWVWCRCQLFAMLLDTCWIYSYA